MILEKLHPLVADYTITVLEELQKSGIPVKLFSGYRAIEEQEKLYNLGRFTINPDGKSIDKPMGNTVTNSRPGNSYHNYGLAIDIVRLDEKGNPTWDYKKYPYHKIGEIGKKNRFEWGGDWEKFPDPPHLQMSFGLFISEVKKIYEIAGLNGLWENLLKRAKT